MVRNANHIKSKSCSKTVGTGVGSAVGAAVGAAVGIGVGAAVGTFETLPSWPLDELVGSQTQTISKVLCRPHNVMLTERACCQNCQTCQNWSGVHQCGQGLSISAKLFKCFQKCQTLKCVKCWQDVTNGVYNNPTHYFIIYNTC